MDQRALLTVISGILVAALLHPVLAQSPPEEPSLPAPEPRHLDELPDLFAPHPTQGPDDPVIEFSAEVLETYVTFLPAQATLIGVGTFEERLGDYRRASIGAFLGSYRGYLLRLDKLPSAGLTEKGRLEKEALRVHLRNVIRSVGTGGAPWNDPNFYVDGSVGAIQALIDRDPSAAIKKAEHLLARMSLLRYFFTVARENLGSCAMPDVRRAMMRLRGAAPLFARVVPEEIQRSGHPQAGTAGAAMSVAAGKEVAAFADWLEKERLPKATAPAPLGAKGWAEWLAAQETTTLTHAQILAVAEADLARLKEEFARAAAKVAADKQGSALLMEMESGQQDPEQARAAARNVIDQLWTWITRSKPVTPSSDDPIIVRETPAFRRRDYPIRSNLPGAYSGANEEAYLEISAPDPGWPAFMMGPWLASYNKDFLPGALMREVYPGRFTAWEAMKQSKIRVCRAIEFPTMSEGWTFVAEELAVRGGFTNGNTRLTIAMLADSIREDTRLIASIRLHTMQLPLRDAAIWMSQAGMWPRDLASVEAEQAMAWPSQAAPGLGRLEILALRDDVRKQKGNAFDERLFYDRLLSCGSAPVSALRSVLFPEAGGALLGASR